MPEERELLLLKKLKNKLLLMNPFQVQMNKYAVYLGTRACDPSLNGRTKITKELSARSGVVDHCFNERRDGFLLILSCELMVKFRGGLSLLYGSMVFS